MAKGKPWTEEEFQFVRDNSGLGYRELADLMPGRTADSVKNVRDRMRKEAEVQPAVKDPGDYVELLSELLVDDWDCMEIWLKWNGYASYKTLSRDRMGYLTLVCTAQLSGYSLSNS